MLRTSPLTEAEAAQVVRRRSLVLSLVLNAAFVHGNRFSDFINWMREKVSPNVGVSEFAVIRFLCSASRLNRAVCSFRTSSDVEVGHQPPRIAVRRLRVFHIHDWTELVHAK